MTVVILHNHFVHFRLLPGVCVYVEKVCTYSPPTPFISSCSLSYSSCPVSNANLSDNSRHAYSIHVVDGDCEYPEDNWCSSILKLDFEHLNVNICILCIGGTY